MEQLQTALIAIKVLRSSVGQVFDSLGNGLRAEHGEENKENKYLLELQELLTTVSVNLRYSYCSMKHTYVCVLTVSY